MAPERTPSERGYLTASEVAAELGITSSGVYKLIARGQLGAIRRSAGRVVVPVRAFAAYRRALDGDSATTSFELATPRLDQLVASFRSEMGCSPEDWVRRWKAGRIEDSPEAMRDLIRAVALMSATTGSRDAASGVDDALATAALFAPSAVGAESG